MPDNARTRVPAQESGLPLALLIHEGGDVDSYLATPEVKGDTLLLDLDDGRRIEINRTELLDRTA